MTNKEKDPVDSLIDTTVEYLYYNIPNLSSSEPVPVLIITDKETNRQDCLVRRVVATRLSDKINPLCILGPTKPTRKIPVIAFSANDGSLTVETETKTALLEASKGYVATDLITVLYIGKNFEGVSGIQKAMSSHLEETGNPIHLFSLAGLDLEGCSKISEKIPQLVS